MIIGDVRYSSSVDETFVCGDARATFTFAAGHVNASRSPRFNSSYSFWGVNMHSQVNTLVTMAAEEIEYRRLSAGRSEGAISLVISTGFAS